MAERQIKIYLWWQNFHPHLKSPLGEWERERKRKANNNNESVEEWWFVFVVMWMCALTSIFLSPTHYHLHHASITIWDLIRNEKLCFPQLLLLFWLFFFPFLSSSLSFCWWWCRGVRVNGGRREKWRMIGRFLCIWTFEQSERKLFVI